MVTILRSFKDIVKYLFKLSIEKYKIETYYIELGKLYQDETLNK